MDLERQQQSLLELLKGRRVLSGDDEYLRKVRSSSGLAVAREVALWWRALGIQQNCPHTAALLKRLSRFDALIELFYCNHPVSPYMEAMSLQFLKLLDDDPDPTVRSVALLEFAVISAAQNGATDIRIDFDREPGALLQAIREGGPLPEPDETHRVHISAYSTPDGTASRNAL